jgi:hypothetical protein
VARDAGRVPANQRTDGPPAYRQPGEVADQRPCLLNAPFWTDSSEQLAYEDAVHEHPRNPTEGALTYAARISGIVTEHYRRAGLAMPRTRMSQREWERRQNELKRQAWDANDWRGM